MVHYWGDDAVGKQARTSAGVQTKLKFRTMPSVLRSVEREVDSKPAHQVYKTKIVEKTDGNEAVSKPQNLKQVQNLRKRVKNEKRLTKDSIINIHGIALDDPTYIHLIQTWPDLLIVFGTQPIINYANEIMTLRDPDFYFSYNTTFTLGHFFLSVLLIRNIIFRTKPFFTKKVTFYSNVYKLHPLFHKKTYNWKTKAVIFKS